MAIRTIRVVGDEILTKTCKPLTKVNERTRVLIDDMFETMYEAEGVGLAAPQVGILKRIVTIDLGDDSGQIVLINPEIIMQEGSQTGYEGCLSLPGKSGVVTRPDHVIVRAYDEDFEQFELEARGMLARCICHECDHLDGHMYTEKVEGEIIDNSELQEADAEE